MINNHEYIWLFITASTLTSFMITYSIMPWWIGRAQELGLTGKDMNKPGNIQVAEAGGVWVSIGAAFGILLFIALQIYILNSYKYVLGFMALALLLILSSFLGFLDDLLGWKKGLRIIYRVVLMAPLAIPLMVIKAGYSVMEIPFIGPVNFGILYPLVLVPIGVLGAANAFNMVAGYNGLEATMALQLMFYTVIYAWINHVWISFEASLIMMGAVLGFLIFNWYPARVFPGNSFTYGFGAYYASLVILGNFEKYGLLLFTLYFLELLLFLRGLKHRVYKENYARINPDGSLEQPYKHIYSITHLAIVIQKKIRGRATERGVVLTINILQSIIGILSLLLTLTRIY
jgi:UDP-N-acetylglucosamine--dolichyl-phosphate N-acetylglucosaminephosphotransferase